MMTLWDRIIAFLLAVLAAFAGLFGLAGCVASSRGEARWEIGMENRNVLVIGHRTAEGNEATAEASTDLKPTLWDTVNKWLFKGADATVAGDAATPEPEPTP